jgi:predicted nucleic acid-binding protein
MLKDVVIDTNVFMHAGNDLEERQAEAIIFVETLLESATKIGVDPGFSVEEANNGSMIWAEYLNHIQESTLGRTAIAYLAQNERIAVFDRAVSQQHHKRVQTTVRDPSDRVFMKVAINTREKVLVSHDFAAFGSAMRLAGRARNGCTITDAANGAALL